MASKPGDEPIGKASAGQTKRVRGITAFATGLQKRLQTGGDLDVADALDSLVTDLQNQISTLRRYAQKTNHGIFGDSDLDRCGTDLWNTCARLRRVDEAPKMKSLLTFGRVFAFLMLDLAQWSEKCSASTVRHLMKIALKAGRCSIDHGDAELGMVAMQRAAIYNGRLRDLSPTLAPDEVTECNRLEAEYLVLRTAQSWREGRLDVAEHMYNEAVKLTPGSGSHLVEHLADTVFEIGKDLSTKKDFTMAVKWLERAHDVINHQQIDQLSRDGVELRLTIVQALVTALLGLQTVDGFERAQNLVKYVESEIGDKLVVLLLGLEVLAKSPAETFDCEAYMHILRRMIQTFGFSDSNFRLVIHHIRKLHDKSPGSGCVLLDEFVRALLGSERNDWIETAIITRVWMAANQREHSASMEDLQGILASVPDPLSAEGAIAAQTLIWKRLEFNYNDGQYDIAEKWCQLALHKVFEKSGPHNVAKLERKMLMCAVGRNDFALARTVFYSLSEATLKEPMTRYVVYKAAVRNGDRDLAMECIDFLSQTQKGKEFLYACVQDSERADNKLVAIEAMKKLTEKYDLTTSNSVHLPALLRCTIRLLYGLLGDDDTGIDHGAVIQDLCTAFESAVSAIEKGPKDADGNKLFDINELEWFSQNSYNLGLKQSGTWGLRSVVRILTSCIKIIQTFPTDMAAPTADDLSLKSIFCHFVISSALVALARTQDDVELQLQDYLVLRKHVAAFSVETEARLDGLDEVSGRDLLQKLSMLLIFDFEAAAQLEQWDELNEIVRRANVCESVETYQAMADCLLRAQPGVDHVFSTMRTLINEIWDIGGMDTKKLPKYFRCLLKIILPFREDLSELLVGEFLKIIREAAGGKKDLPCEEIEWVAVTVFNQAIDFRDRGQDVECQRWAQLAINLAHYCGDDNHLEKSLHAKYTSLKLDG